MNQKKAKALRRQAKGNILTGNVSILNINSEEKRLKQLYKEKKKK